MWKDLNEVKENLVDLARKVTETDDTSCFVNLRVALIMMDYKNLLDEDFAKEIAETIIPYSKKNI